MGSARVVFAGGSQDWARNLNDLYERWELRHEREITARAVPSEKLSVSLPREWVADLEGFVPPLPEPIDADAAARLRNELKYKQAFLQNMEYDASAPGIGQAIKQVIQRIHAQQQVINNLLRGIGRKHKEQPSTETMLTPTKLWTEADRRALNEAKAMAQRMGNQVQMMKSRAALDGRELTDADRDLIVDATIAEFELSAAQVQKMRSMPIAESELVARQDRYIETLKDTIITLQEKIIRLQERLAGGR